MKPTVLILCIGNSCRSQMAEGLLRAAAGDLVEVRSAGSKPAGVVHPRAIAVLKEIDIDISAHRSKHVSEFFDREIATIITVCGDADDGCPLFPGKAMRHHWPFSDPTHTQGTEEQIIADFRKVRDEMKRMFDAYSAGLRDRMVSHHCS